MWPLWYTSHEVLKKSFSASSHFNQRYLKALSSLETNAKSQYPWVDLLINSNQAVVESWDKMIKDYPRQPWGLSVEPEIVEHKTFCNLIRFKNEGAPPLLIAAPLSGHYATLLKDTVKKSLEGFDVYITDWLNCREIPWQQNGQTQDFSLSTYIDYLIDFMATVSGRHPGEQLNMLAVCQPTVPVLVANAYLSQIKSNAPRAANLILMGGPVDTRKSPTSVNDYAQKHDIHWFENNVIQPVPFFYPGFMRPVYPGFLQYMGFVSMNLDKHIQSHVDFFNDMLAGSDMKAQKHKDFYAEYNSVMDLPAQYYLDTIEEVFIKQSLAKGEFMYRGEQINLANLKNTNILAIEGELDDISGLGQTKAALELSTGLPARSKKYFCVPAAGHYGIFAGRTWQNVVYPEIQKFCK